MEPAALMPSTGAFRGAVALLVVSLVAAVWHLVAWPLFPSPEPLALAPLATRTPFAAIAPPVATPTARPPETPVTQGASATPAASPAGTTVATAAATPSPTPRPGRRYSIESGDTLSGIASQFGTTVDAITAANSITTETVLRIGQELVIP